MLKDEIKRLRQEHGMSQDELASRVHVVRQTVSKWERGASVPDAETLRALAETLGVTPNELLGHGPEPDPDPDPHELALRASLLEARAIQKDHLDTIYRRTKRILLAVCAVVLVAMAIGAVCLQMNTFIDGTENGFDLEGTYGYRADDGSPVYASFGLTEEDSGLWQLADFSAPSRNPVNGRFVATADPNLYELQDEKGTPVGWASLAGVRSFLGKLDGLLYMQYGDQSFRLQKFDRGVWHHGRGFMHLTVTDLYNLGTVEERKEEAKELPEINEWAEEWFDLDFADGWYEGPEGSEEPTVVE